MWTVLGLQGFDALGIGTLRFHFQDSVESPVMIPSVASEVAMRPKKHRTTGSGDLFRARLDQIINMKHELVQLAGKSIGTGSTARSRRSIARTVGRASRPAS